MRGSSPEGSMLEDSRGVGCTALRRLGRSLGVLSIKGSPARTAIHGVCSCRLRSRDMRRFLLVVSERVATLRRGESLWQANVPTQGHGNATHRESRRLRPVAWQSFRRFSTLSAAARRRFSGHPDYRSWPCEFRGAGVSFWRSGALAGVSESRKTASMERAWVCRPASMIPPRRSASATGHTPRPYPGPSTNSSRVRCAARSSPRGDGC